MNRKLLSHNITHGTVEIGLQKDAGRKKGTLLIHSNPLATYNSFIYSHTLIGDGTSFSFLQIYN